MANYEISFWVTSHNSTGKESIGYIIVHHSEEEDKSNNDCCSLFNQVTIIIEVFLPKVSSIMFGDFTKIPGYRLLIVS